MNDGNYDDGYGDSPGESPFAGIDGVITNALIDRVVIFTCRKIASSRDRRNFPAIYRYLIGLPVKAVLQMPKPLLDDFWKFVNSVCQADPTDNSAHGLLALLQGYTAMLNHEDTFQQDFHDIPLRDLMDDYQDRLLDLGEAMRKNDETPAEWAKALFRQSRKALPNPKGNINQGEEAEATDNE